MWLPCDGHKIHPVIMASISAVILHVFVTFGPLAINPIWSCGCGPVATGNWSRRVATVHFTSTLRMIRERLNRPLPSSPWSPPCLTSHNIHSYLSCVCGGGGGGGRGGLQRLQPWGIFRRACFVKKLIKLYWYRTFQTYSRKHSTIVGGGKGEYKIYFKVFTKLNRIY